MNKLILSLVMAGLAFSAHAQVASTPGKTGSFRLINTVQPGAADKNITVFEVDNAGVKRENTLSTLYDDFNGPTLDSNRWTAVGANTGVTPTVFVSDSGIISLTTVASSTAAAATSQIGSELNWRAGRGNLVMETRLKLDTSSSVAVFAGFADSKSRIAGLPVRVSATAGGASGVTAATTTSNTGNFVGLLFDASTSLPAFVTTTQPTWRFGGNSDSVSTTMTSTGIGVTPTTWYTLRTSVDKNGKACFTINETPYGCVASAVSTTVSLTPYVGVANGAAALRNLQVDYIQVQQKRQGL